VFNNIALRVNAALAGLGLAYLSEDQVQEHVPKDVSSGSSAIGARRFQAITSTIQAADKLRQRSLLLVEALRYRGSSR